VNYDFIIIGGGIAGASLAAQLGQEARVAILEMEKQPGFHSTGRSAAYFAPAYGNYVVREITAASESFYQEPSDKFTNVPLLRPRGSLFVAEERQRESVVKMMEESPHLLEVNSDEIRSQVPIIKPGKLTCGAFDEGGGDLDVDAILQAYLRQFRSNNGEIITACKLLDLDYRDGVWTLQTEKGVYTTPVVINSAGAWADQIANLAGLEPLGIKPYRRTALLVDSPTDLDISNWPLTVDVDEDYYFKPDAGQLLISPAEETPSEPCDAQPDDIDIAVVVDRLQQVLDLEVRKINHSWTGLRSFAPDRTFVVGFDPRCSGFFWFAGQGGYGVQAAPGLADIGAAIMTGNQPILTKQSFDKLRPLIAPDRFL
jgi:D-arginine dehydrogenase